MEKFDNAKLQLLLYQPNRDKYSQKRIYSYVEHEYDGIYTAIN